MTIGLKSQTLFKIFLRIITPTYTQLMWIPHVRYTPSVWLSKRERNNIRLGEWRVEIRGNKEGCL